MSVHIPLKTLQQWMQSVIEHPGSNDEAWKSERAQKELPFEDAYAGVLPSKTLSPVERIAIYRRMFFLRMTESMAIDYPGVRHFLGEEVFDRLVVEEYVQKYPSHSYTLNHLGRSFPEFIQESTLKEKAFLYDLARLELAVTNVMEAEESPALAAEEVTALSPDQWSTARLATVAALELLSFRYNVCDYLNAVNNESATPSIIRGEFYGIVYRNQFRTYWDQLSNQQHLLLSSLSSGATLGDAVNQLAERFPDSVEELRTDLFHWFNEWINAGYFSTIRH